MTAINCNLERMFVQMFGPPSSRVTFESLNEIDNQVKQLELRTGLAYRIRSTEPSVGNAKVRVYECVRKRFTLPPTRGLRRRWSRQTQCPSTIRFKRVLDGPFVVTKVIMDHDHEVSIAAGRLEPSHRRLTQPEADIITPLILSNAPSFTVCDYIRRWIGKVCSTQDVCGRSRISRRLLIIGSDRI